MGHSRLKTTERYPHLSQETLLEADDAAAKARGIDWDQLRWNKERIHRATRSADGLGGYGELDQNALIFDATDANSMRIN